jgi:hypothetical protein
MDFNGYTIIGIVFFFLSFYVGIELTLLVMNSGIYSFIAICLFFLGCINILLSYLFLKLFLNGMN